ncbi:MAG: hypothetical protein ABSF70_07290 [Terracidiphilus sp.]|jgi:hypothetical protein
MPTNPPATPPAGAADPKQAAFAALKAVLNTASIAMNNKANTPAAQAAARDLWDETNDQLDALDQAVFTGNTVQLQAGAAAMTPAMTQLKALQAKLKALGDNLKEAATIIAGIDKAVGELGALGII